MTEELVNLLKHANVTPIEDLPALVIPNNMRIASTIHLFDEAPRSTGHISAESLDSLVDYLSRFGSTESAVFASLNQNGIMAVLDWHGHDSNDTGEALATGLRFASNGGFARHIICLPLQFSEQWKAWTKINNDHLPQKALAEFIEEYLGDIAAPDAASVLEAVLTLAGKKSVNYKNATRLANGDVSIVWEETTEARAGQGGDIKVPSELTLRLPVYAGCEEDTTFDVRTMFRYHIHDGKLTFQLKMLGIERIRELAFKAVFGSLVKKLGETSKVPVYQAHITKFPLEIYSK